MDLALFFLGLSLLVLGAELVVRSASRVATMLGITPMVIGLTIVSVGTSAPELAIGIVSGLQGKGGLAVGNIAGTNILNLLFILGLTAVVQPLPLDRQIFRLELPTIVLTAGLFTVLAWDGVLSLLDGLIMLAGGVLYTGTLLRFARLASQRAKQEYRAEFGPETIPEIQPKWRLKVLYGVLLVAGIALTVGGAELLVRGAAGIARALGVSDTIIGLTIVAIGTSAPELVTTIVGTIKGERDVAVGNLLGSSIYNILIILSVPCIIAPGGLPVDRQLLLFDIPLMSAVAVGAIPVFFTGRRVGRAEGGLGVAIYLTYLMWLVFYRS